MLHILSSFPTHRGQENEGSRRFGLQTKLCLWVGDSPLFKERVRTGEAVREQPADLPPHFNPKGVGTPLTSWDRVSPAKTQCLMGLSGSQLRQSENTHIFCLPFPIRRQSDVLQAGGEVLPVQFDSSSAAREDLPDGGAGAPGAAMTNPGLMTSRLGYLEPRCSHGACRDPSAPFPICSSLASLQGRDHPSSLKLSICASLQGLLLCLSLVLNTKHHLRWCKRCCPLVACKGNKNLLSLNMKPQRANRAEVGMGGSTTASPSCLGTRHGFKSKLQSQNVPGSHGLSPELDAAAVRWHLWDHVPPWMLLQSPG